MDIAHQNLKIASNPETDIDILRQYSVFEDKLIRGAVAYNVNCPEDVLAKLAADPDAYVGGCLRRRSSPVVIRKPSRITGKTLRFRNAGEADAEFIVNLRTAENKSRFISQTSGDIGKQIEWLKHYANDNSQAYFIMESPDDTPLGTIRLYDPQGLSFCWGSWVIKDGAPASTAIESVLMIYQFALYLGFLSAHFDVRRQNENVWKFHEKFGATRVGETQLDFYYRLTPEAIDNAYGRFKKFMKVPIEIEFESNRRV